MDKPKIVSVSGADSDQTQRDALGVPPLPGGEPQPKRSSPETRLVAPPNLQRGQTNQSSLQPKQTVLQPAFESESEIPPERMTPESPLVSQPVSRTQTESEVSMPRPVAEPSPSKPENPEQSTPGATSKPPDPLAVEPEQPVVQVRPVLSDPVSAPPWVARNQPRPKVFMRPEFDDREDEALARDLLSDSKPRIVARRDVAQEYREQASRDILPPSPPPHPLTMDEQRAHAKGLAQKIHEGKQSEGFFSKLKRRLGWP